ncbi:hypothetical protein CWO91_31135 [Bradyrhizobium genosp. SA-3]|uniref:hypothetical protein n=1 Tax=Bradyrhizobium genosp. SA-3 TaxID=508868 RepID=UPI001029313A|nr:hypothetical protein [Bradyrhizobium genosp. SA-3]RZN04509.1 hypothetical protein CWO91_31135 [Bradyrhizobium genosp. SA-3]
MPTPLRARRVTREELYQMVWDKPLIRLAEEFGITGKGLAKVCDRLDVPYPPRGHWAKKEAGKPVVTLKLPPRRDGIPNAADIHPTPPKPAPSPAAEQGAATVADSIRDVAVPESHDNLHPRVQAWIADHKKRQKERELENRNRRRDIGWASPLIPDLTERDLYRFRATSAIFYAVEKASGTIEKSSAAGKITFLIDGHQVECSIVEKMVQSLNQWEEQRKWTAFTEYCKSDLDSSGFLRVAITTYLQARRPEWVESQKIKIGQLMPTIVGAIMAAGPTLEKMKREREEQQKRYHEEEARRYEARRLREIDEKRWNKFREYAVNWDERERLLTFLAEVEARLATEGDVTVSDRTLRAWVDWAKAKAEAINPFGGGAVGMFETIARVKQWS